MYNLNLKDGEVILFESKDVILETNNFKSDVAVVVTNYRLLILTDINKNTFVDVLSQTKKLFVLPAYEINLSINLTDIMNKKFIDGGTEFLYNENLLFFYEVNLLEYL